MKLSELLATNIHFNGWVKIYSKKNHDGLRQIYYDGDFNTLTSSEFSEFIDIDIFSIYSRSTTTSESYICIELDITLQDRLTNNATNRTVIPRDPTVTSNYPDMFFNELEFLNTSSWDNESILTKCGYSVSAKNKLTRIQRQKILTHIIENGYMTKEQITTLLNRMINLRIHQTRFQNAIEKWNEDITFVKNY